MKTLILLALLFFNLTTLAQPVLKFEIDNEPYVIEQLTSGHGIIWSIEFIDNTQILFGEKNGRILKLNLETKNVQFIQKFPHTDSIGHGGLLDLAKSPAFQGNRIIYVTYSKRLASGSTTAVAKASLVDNKFSDWTEIFAATPLMPLDIHFGSRMAFDSAGYLYVSIGDRFQRQRAQSLTHHHGKVLRINAEDGSAPADNPFANTPNALNEIWSLGHRNPQGLIFDASTNQIISSEHGPMGGDEINFISKGKNYGWPVITHGREYVSGAPIGEGTSKAGMEDPFKYYVPSIAPANILLYRGDRLTDFKDKFILGGLAQRHLNLVSINANATDNNPCEIRVGTALNERIRDVIQGPDELIYFSTDSGKIFRITKP